MMKVIGGSIDTVVQLTTKFPFWLTKAPILELMALAIVDGADIKEVPVSAIAWQPAVPQ